jgi:Phasin protein
MTENGKAIAPESEKPPERKAREKKSPAVSGAASAPAADTEAYRMAADENAVPASNDPMIAVVEAAVIPEFEFLEEIGKEGFEAAKTATLSLAERFRELASESESCTKEFWNSSYAFAGELRQAQSPVDAVEVQIDFVRSAYVRLLDHFLTLSGFYWNLFRLAYSAGETEAAKVKY